MEFALQQPCQSRRDLHVYLASPAGGRHPCSLDEPASGSVAAKQAQTDAGGATGCERCALGSGSQAGPACGSRRGAVPCSGSGGRGRGVPLLLCDRSNGGTRCLGDWNMVNQPVRDLNWRICVLWKIQAHPRPLVNNGSGPFHCPERRSFHLTNGFAFNCSRHQ